MASFTALPSPKTVRCSHTSFADSDRTAFPIEVVMSRPPHLLGKVLLYVLPLQEMLVACLVTGILFPALWGSFAPARIRRFSV